VLQNVMLINMQTQQINANHAKQIVPLVLVV